jgi:hypothetical protein
MGVATGSDSCPKVYPSTHLACHRFSLYLFFFLCLPELATSYLDKTTNPKHQLFLCYETREQKDLLAELEKGAAACC